jgi:hypothetical protein
LEAMHYSVQLPGCMGHMLSLCHKAEVDGVIELVYLFVINLFLTPAEEEKHI